MVTYATTFNLLYFGENTRDMCMLKYTTFYIGAIGWISFFWFLDVFGARSCLCHQHLPQNNLCKAPGSLVAGLGEDKDRKIGFLERLLDSTRPSETRKARSY